MQTCISKSCCQMISDPVTAVTQTQHHYASIHPEGNNYIITIFCLAEVFTGLGFIARFSPCAIYITASTRWLRKWIAFNKVTTRLLYPNDCTIEVGLGLNGLDSARTETTGVASSTTRYALQVRGVTPKTDGAQTIAGGSKRSTLAKL